MLNQDLCQIKVVGRYMDIKKICVELQSFGVRMPGNKKGRRGGAGPAEGQLLIIEDCFINVPTESDFVRKSPYSIISEADRFLLLKHKKEISYIQFPTRPKYYDIETEDKVALHKIAIMHGKDCFASTIFQHCAYWGTDRQCSFCGIGLSLESGDTVIEKKPDDLALAAERAKFLDSAVHVTLTSGTRADEKETAGQFYKCIRAVKNRTGMPVHVQIAPPADNQIIDMLKDAGADTVGIHMETCNLEILKRISPAKAELGLDAYIDSWQHAVSVFGRNQVSSFVIAGFDETVKSIVEGVSRLSSMGVFPYVLPFRPVPGTIMAGSLPPDPEMMYRIYEQTADILKAQGLNSKLSKAGCVRCGSCSCLSLFEHDR